jgi:periplasmic protein TonB
MSSTSMYQELDVNIDALLAGAEMSESADPTMRELMAIARELREMPSPEFREQLAEELDAVVLAAQDPRQLASRVGRGAQVGELGHRDERDLAEVMPTLLHGGNLQGRTSGKTFAASFAMHAAVAALVLTSGLWVAEHGKQIVVGQVVDISPYVLPESVDVSHGGGGGGDRDKIDATKGNLPKFAKQQITPPAIVVRNENPKLPVEPTVVVPPNMKLPQMALNMGDPMSGVSGPMSNGTGSGGGIGTGDGGGVGSGHGAGVGPGWGGGIGGGAYRVGGGVSAPVALFAPDPEYSEEARKTKYQGTVVLWVVVGPDGRPHEMRVQRSLGMGLDQKALDAVKKWKFEPALKDGKPVAVQINVEVNFRLY